MPPPPQKGIVSDHPTEPIWTPDLKVFTAISKKKCIAIWQFFKVKLKKKSFRTCPHLEGHVIGIPPPPNLKNRRAKIINSFRNTRVGPGICVHILYTLYIALLYRIH